MASFAPGLCTAGGKEEQGKIVLERARHAEEGEAGLLVK